MHEADGYRLASDFWRCASHLSWLTISTWKWKMVSSAICLVETLVSTLSWGARYSYPTIFLTISWNFPKSSHIWNWRQKTCSQGCRWVLPTVSPVSFRRKRNVTLHMIMRYSSWLDNNVRAGNLARLEGLTFLCLKYKVRPLLSSFTVENNWKIWSLPTPNAVTFTPAFPSALASIPPMVINVELQTMCWLKYPLEDLLRTVTSCWFNVNTCRVGLIPRVS